MGRHLGVSVRRDTLLVAAALVVIAVAGAQLVLSPTVTGVTTDEPVQLDRTETWLEDGWFVPAAQLEGGEPRPGAENSPFVYGPAFGATAHSVNALVGNEPWGTTESESADWSVRHLVVALIGLLTAGLVALSVRALTGSLPIALWSAAALLAIPIWTGMSFFNVKDVPAAAGYTSFTAGLIVAWRGVDTRRGTALVVALIAAGVAFGIGTRIALWVAFLASLLTFAMLVWARGRSSASPAASSRPGWAIGGGLLLGLGALTAAYPKAFTRPLDLLGDSVSVSSDYPYEGVTLTAGQLLSQDPPLWYLPAWLFASMPVLLLGLAAVGLATVAVLLLRARSAGLAGALRQPQAIAILVVLQLALLPIVSVVGGATMYTGLRQFLFAVPALAILAGLGACWIREAALASGSRLRRGAAAALLVGAIAVPTAEQVLLFPFNYAYVNPIAGLGGVNGNWETDYWGSSLREAVSRIPPDEEPMCGGLEAPGSTADPGIGPCGLAPMVAPFLGERDGVPTPGDPRVWSIGFRRGGSVPVASCEQVDDVTRWLRGEDVVMSYVLRCDPVPGA